MKKRQQTEKELYGPAKLSITKEEFKTVLEERINKGNELLNRQIGTHEDYEKFKSDNSKWNSYNEEYLKQSFTYQDNQYLSEYRCISFQMGFGGESISTKIQRSKGIIKKYVGKLDNILEKIDLIPLERPEIIQDVEEVRDYFSLSRIEELKEMSNDNFDLRKLIKILEESNVSYKNQCYLGLSSLLRMLLDHIPPIFGMNSFKQIVSSFAFSKSDKGNMEHLYGCLKNISDGNLHGQISDLEILPNETTIDFRPDMDVLLKNIIKQLS